MRIDTAEAFVRLVAIFGDALDRAGQALPEDIEEQLLADPVKACEELNAQALAAGAIDEETDAALAALYETLLPSDARSPMDDVVKSRLRRSLGIVIAALRERAQEREAAAAAEEARREAERRAAEEERAAAEAAAAAEDVNVAEVELEEVLPEMAAEEPQPKKRRRGRPRKERPAEAEDGAKAAASATESPAAPAPSSEAPLAEAAAPVPAADEQTLTVDQVAAILGVNKQEVYKLIKAGKVAATKKGRSWAIPASAIIPA